MGFTRVGVMERYATSANGIYKLELLYYAMVLYKSAEDTVVKGHAAYPTYGPAQGSTTLVWLASAFIS